MIIQIFANWTLFGMFAWALFSVLPVSWQRPASKTKLRRRLCIFLFGPLAWLYLFLCKILGAKKADDRLT